jgi:hypothetical protein
VMIQLAVAPQVGKYSVNPWLSQKIARHSQIFRVSMHLCVQL